MDFRKVVVLAFVGLGVAGTINPEQTEYRRLRNSLHVVYGIGGYDIKKLSVEELRSLVFEGSHETDQWGIKSDLIRELMARKAFSGVDWCKVLAEDSDPMFWSSCGEIILKRKPVFTKDQREELGLRLVEIESQMSNVGFRFWLQANDMYNFCKKGDLVGQRINRLRAYANRLELEVGNKISLSGGSRKAGSLSP